MSPGEFSAHDDFKRSWGEKIVTHKRYPVYRELRARVSLRKRFGVEPTLSQFKEEADHISQKGYVDASGLTVDDVVQAFERGDENVNTIRLVCVDCVHDKARQYILDQEASYAKDRLKARARGNRTCA